MGYVSLLAVVRCLHTRPLALPYDISVRPDSSLPVEIFEKFDTAVLKTCFFCLYRHHCPWGFTNIDVKRRSLVTMIVTRNTASFCRA